MLLSMIVSACVAIGDSKPVCTFDVYRNEHHRNEARCNAAAENRAERLRMVLTSTNSRARAYVVGECGDNEKIDHMVNAIPDFTHDLGGENYYINDPAKD